MLRLSSSSKIVSRLLARRRNCLDFGNVFDLSVKNSVDHQGPLGRFVQSRRSYGLASLGSQSVDKVNGVGGERIVSAFESLHYKNQTRGFLGWGDGEEGDSLSKQHDEKCVIGYSPEQLFAVVAAVDLYEDFLPWCQRSRVIRRNNDESFEAELQIGFKFFIENYVSHVRLMKPRYIKTAVSDSALFDHLINIWEFNEGPVPGTCDLHFFVDFKFRSPLYRQVASMFFTEVVSRLVNSFSDRCGRIYGPGAQVLERPYGQSA